jgi:hypothetical protein
VYATFAQSQCLFLRLPGIESRYLCLAKCCQKNWTEMACVSVVQIASVFVLATTQEDDESTNHMQ